MGIVHGSAFSEDPDGALMWATRVDFDLQDHLLVPRRGPVEDLGEHDERVIERIRDRVIALEHDLGQPGQLRWSAEHEDVDFESLEPLDLPLPWGHVQIEEHDRDQWSRANAGEVLPVVMTPLTWSLMGDALDNGFHAPWEHLTEGRRFVALYDGYVYFNVGLMLELITDRLGLLTSHFLLAMGGPEARQPVTERVNYRRMLANLPFLLGRVRKQRGLRHRWEAERERALAERDALRALDLDERSNRELLLAVVSSGQFSGEFVEYLMECQTATFGQIQMLLWLSESWVGNRELALRLLQGIPGVLTAESNLELWQLADRAAQDATTAAVVAATAPEQLLETLAADPVTAWLATGLNQFLEQHGHRAATELELSEPRWVEQPELLLATFQSYVANPQQSSADQLHERQVTARKEAERDAKQALTSRWIERLLPLRWWFFRAQMHEAQAMQPLRENPKYVFLQLNLEQRRIYLELGRRWHAHGALEDPQDIFWLLSDETLTLRRRINDEPLVGRMRSRIRRRRQQYEQWAAHPAAPIRDPHGEPIEQPAATQPRADRPGTMYGIAASTGTATGTARVATTPAEGRQLAAGEILVARFTDPGWTPIFPLAAAVVTEIGGMLSHGAVVAREYGIPAVVNVQHATEAIHSGDRIEVDGAAGRVTILERA